MEQNKLIARFMGYEIPKQTHRKLNWIIYNGVFQAMQFHSSWDWLMPVIEKIENLEVKGLEEDKEFIQQFTVEISNGQCVIHRDFSPQYWGTEEDFLELYDCNNTSKIESTFSAVVKFIEWLNINYEKYN